MLFDSFMMAYVAEEIRVPLVGSQVEKVYCKSISDVVIRVENQNKAHHLLMSAETTRSRIYLTKLNRERASTLHPFGQLMHKRLCGSIIQSISLPFGTNERVLKINFVAISGEIYSVIFEIIGRMSNIVLTDESGVVLNTIKFKSSTQSHGRQHTVAEPFRDPPSQYSAYGILKRTAANDSLVADFNFDSENEGRRWLTDSWAGVSPLLATEAIQRAPVLTAASLYSSLKALQSIKSPFGTPVIWRDEHDQVIGAYPIKLNSVEENRQQQFSSLSEALDSAVNSIVLQDGLEGFRSAYLKPLRQRQKLRSRELVDIQNGINNADRAEEYEQSGHLIMANHTTERADRTYIEVSDYYADPDTSGLFVQRKIEVDPVLSLQDNATQYFRKSRKARSSRDNLLSRAAAIELELPRLHTLIDEILLADSMDRLKQLLIGTDDLLLTSRRSVTNQQYNTHDPKESKFDGHRIKTFHTPDGWEILVGENATSNDFLTTKLARPQDIWMHVRVGASAHGIIRARKQIGNVSPTALQMAAEQVAARSESKHSNTIPVDYTLKKYVRKPRKSDPGAVYYQNEKTIYVNGIHGNRLI